ncbi:MAG: FHA domain-containing protein [Spartobacteria bacterium]|nr:FHA domain-containing protein [Spartobacteria bacterium]
MAKLLHKDGTVSDLGFLKNNEFAVLGTSAKADIRLHGKGIHAIHCHIINVRGRYYLRPLSHRKAVYVNNTQIREKELLLENGQTLRLGDWTMIYQIAGIDHLEEAAKGTASSDSTRNVSPKEQLKQRIHRLLLDRMDLKGLEQAGDETESKELRRHAADIIRDIMKEFDEQLRILQLDHDAFYNEVVDDVLGLGPLEGLLRDDTVSEIMVGAGYHIFVERRGVIEQTNRQFSNHNQLITIIERIVGPLGRRIDESSPIVDARLPDGSRVNAVISPIALDGPSLNIRKFAKTPLKVDDLLQFGSLSPQMADFLRIAVAKRRNIIISGGTGSGKTTLLNVVSSFISPSERIVTIEDSAELRLEQAHVIRLEARPPNIEGRGEISIRTLVRNALRMRPDRIIVGECRGGESLDMLQAMNTGHDGSLTTVHANSPHDVISRLETMVLMSGMELPVKAIRQQIASAVHLVCQQNRLSDGSRRIVSIAELNYIEEEDSIEMQDIFVFKADGFDATGRTVGHYMPTGAIPLFINSLRERGVPVDMSMFVIKE